MACTAPTSWPPTAPRRSAAGSSPRFCGRRRHHRLRPPPERSRRTRPRRLRIGTQRQRPRRRPNRAGERPTIRPAHARRVLPLRHQRPTRAATQQRPPNETARQDIHWDIRRRRLRDLQPRLLGAVLRPQRRRPARGKRPGTGLADTVCTVIDALPDHGVSSFRDLCARLRTAGHCFRTTKIRDTVDDLIVAERLTEVPGNRGSKGYRTVSRDEQQ